MRQKLSVVLVAGLGGLFTVLDVACAQPWAATTAPGDLPWKALAASADGTKLVAAANTSSYSPALPALIYVATNAGATWIKTSALTNDWQSVASSADATRLVAVASSFGPGRGRGDGLIYTSPDLGTSWTPTSAPSNTWSSVASSADGTRLVAVAAPTWDWNLHNYVGDGAIYSSPDSGASWTQTSAPTNYWTSVASSADGTKLVAAASDGSIYTSTNSGATWTATGAPSGAWSAVACSADGSRVVAGGYSLPPCTLPYLGPWRLADAPANDLISVASSVDGTKVVAVPARAGTIFTSSNSGATWTPTTVPNDRWTSVASSADGTKLVALSPDDGFDPIISTNSGATWTPAGAPAVSYWSAVASSADGSNIVAVGDGVIFTLRSPAPVPPLPPSPQLAVGFSGATLGLSWLVPSTLFVLQQNSDLSSTNWVDVPTPPTLDLTNLH